jgi:DNA-binding NarL/FixJ family response regulator
LVDDHPLLRKCLAELLFDQPGIDLIGEATDGEEAVEMALQLRPDVILMDVSMPKMDGIEATRRIKESAPDIRIIGLSSHERGEMESTMRNAGADDYLVKFAATEDWISAILNQCPQP